MAWTDAARKAAAETRKRHVVSKSIYRNKQNAGGITNPMTLSKEWRTEQGRQLKLHRSYGKVFSQKTMDSIAASTTIRNMYKKAKKRK